MSDQQRALFDKEIGTSNLKTEATSHITWPKKLVNFYEKSHLHISFCTLEFSNICDLLYNILSGVPSLLFQFFFSCRDCIWEFFAHHFFCFNWEEKFPSLLFCVSLFAMQYHPCGYVASLAYPPSFSLSLSCALATANPLSWSKCKIYPLPKYLCFSSKKCTHCLPLFW